MRCEIGFLSCFAQSGGTSKINDKSVFTRSEVGNLKSQPLKQIFMVVAFYGFIIDLNNKQWTIRNQGYCPALEDSDHTNQICVMQRSALLSLWNIDIRSLSKFAWGEDVLLAPWWKAKPSRCSSAMLRFCEKGPTICQTKWASYSLTCVLALTALSSHP